MSKWDLYNLYPLLIQGLEDLGFTEPTAIQCLSLNKAINDFKDIIGTAETGSGKTLAFGLPILNDLLKNDDYESDPETLPCLILAPSRELSSQIVKHLKAVAKFTKIRIVSIVGGLSIEKQERVLRRKPHIVVATPGRLWDIMKENEYIAPSNLSYLVIDEADRMIVQGQRKELAEILKQTEITEDNEGFQDRDNIKETEDLVTHEVHRLKSNNAVRHTYIFSATISMSEGGKQRILNNKVSKKNLKEIPTTFEKLFDLIIFKRKVEIIKSSISVINTNITLSEIDCMETEKDNYLYYFILKYPHRTLVFVNSVGTVRRLVTLLTNLKLPALPMHAEMEQRQRLKNMDRFQENDRCILVSTDVTSRGLDIPNVDHVIHYHIPRNVDVFIHRSGRTARAFNKGLTLALVAPSEMKFYAMITNKMKESNRIIKKFPVEMQFMDAIDERIKLAIDVSRLSDSIKRVKHEKSWLEKAIRECDLEDEEDLSRKLKIDPSKERKEKLLRKDLDLLLKKRLVPEEMRKYLPLNQEEKDLTPGNALEDVEKYKEKRIRKNPPVKTFIKTKNPYEQKK